jgi:threonylcarbamoyladenosine tRNA methylthiotransferase MtaB
MLAKTKVPRFRLASLEPVEVTERMLEIYKNSRMTPHFHMSIQSANTDVLFHMKRKYTQDDVAKSLNAIAEKVPNSFVGMDVITGFPTETEEQFQDTVKAMRECQFDFAYIARYSSRSGTLATTRYGIQRQERAPGRHSGVNRYWPGDLGRRRL